MNSMINSVLMCLLTDRIPQFENHWYSPFIRTRFENYRAQNFKNCYSDPLCACAVKSRFPPLPSSPSTLSPLNLAASENKCTELDCAH